MHCCIGRAGLAVFQFNLIFAAWIKFPPPYHAAAVVMTVVLGSGFLALAAVALRWSSHALAPGTTGPVRCRGASCWPRGARGRPDPLLHPMKCLRRYAAAVIAMLVVLGVRPPAAGCWCHVPVQQQPGSRIAWLSALSIHSELLLQKGDAGEGGMCSCRRSLSAIVM